MEAPAGPRASAGDGGGLSFSSARSPPPLLTATVATAGAAGPGHVRSDPVLGRPDLDSRWPVGFGASGGRCLRLWSRRRRRRRHGAPGSGPGVRIRRSQGRGRRPRWWGTRPVAAGGEVGCDIGGCLGRRRWSVAASSCGTGTRAAEPGPAMRGPDGGGDGRRSCAAAACSRRVDAPLKGLPWGGGTATMAVLAGRGFGFATRRSC